MKDQSSLEILAFTDPVCTWCWGSEPVLRKLETCYGDAVHIRYVMGGLVEDIRAFYDRANDIGGDAERSNAQIARHWLEASERHGMPVRTEGFRLFSADTVSTYPQNIAFKAAELTNPGLAARYLRRMREASAAEARETGRQEGSSNWRATSASIWRRLSATSRTDRPQQPSRKIWRQRAATAHAASPLSCSVMASMKRCCAAIRVFPRCSPSSTP